MLKIKVWFKVVNAECEIEERTQVLNDLRPRRYMLGYDFKALLKYTKDSLNWHDIDERDVTMFSFYDDTANYWVSNISPKGCEDTIRIY